MRKVSSYTLAAELLLLHAANRDRTWIYSHPERKLTRRSRRKLSRSNPPPRSWRTHQHLTCKQEFWGLEFEVSPDVLIPRPETEHLVEVALDRLAVREVRAGRDPRLTGENISIVDIGTGSGCIVVALAKELSRRKNLRHRDFSKTHSKSPNETPLATISRIAFNSPNQICSNLCPPLSNSI